eukprot:snap_masked-scaffold342_size201858-processed-gene-1.5 protein:Tk00011 transcript:snap_masked-scaffold342_size201858-processed-gene-1.5-mRNA-1 annotation:"nad-dependent protein deacetylase sirtuin-2"
MSHGEAKKLWQIIAALSATFGAFSLGLGLSWTSPALPHIAECEAIGECDFPQDLGKDVGSWISSLLTIGALVSSFVTGILIAKIGPKWTMIIMAIPSIIGWVILTITEPLQLGDPWLFYVGRILTGFGGGAFSLASPMYISEIAEISIRGALGSLMQLQVTFGVLFNNAVGIALPWPILTGICIVFPVIMAVLMFFMPESPSFYLSHGKEAEAEASLRRFRGPNYNIKAEMAEIRAVQEEQKRIGTVSMKAFFTQAIYVKPTLIMLGLMFFQQFSGINAVLFNLTEIFIKSHSSMDPGVAATLVAVVQFVATGIAVLIVERFGRKILLIISDALMCVSILALGVFFYLDENKTVECPGEGPGFTDSSTWAPEECVPYPDGFDPELIKTLGFLPLVSLMIYVFAFSIGFGPLPWMLNGEMFEVEARGLGSSLATAFNWLCAFIVSKFTPNIQDLIMPSGSYFMYAAICAVGTVFIVFLVPETRATIGAFGLGSGMAWTSPTLPSLTNCEGRNNTCTFEHEFTKEEGSWIGSSYTLGAMVSGIVTGFLLAKIGRKWTMVLMAVPFIAGWLLLCLTVPLNLDQAFWFYIGRVLAVTMGILMLFMPETPYFLLMKGKDESSQKSLQWLRGKHYDIGSESNLLKKSVKEQQESTIVSFRDVLTRPVYLKPFLIMLALHFFQQFCGINVIVFYLADIFIAAGLNVDNSLAAAAVVSCTQVIATGAAIFVVERLGRKILLIFSATVMAVAIMALGVYFYLKSGIGPIEECNDLDDTLCDPSSGANEELAQTLGWLPLVSLIVYKFAFSVGFGPLPWMMNGEFFALEAKPVSSTSATVFNWLCAFLVSKFSVNIEYGIGTSGMYFMFSGVCLVAAVFVFFVVPETRGKSPEDMRMISHLVSQSQPMEGRATTPGDHGNGEKPNLHEEDPEKYSDSSSDSEDVGDGGDEVDGTQEDLIRRMLQMELNRGQPTEKPKQVLDEVSFEGVIRYLKSGKVSKIITMAGAGISTSAGIPDFRSPGTGLYSNLQKYNLPNPQSMFDIGFFKNHPEPFFHLAKELYPGQFQPTPSHYFVKILEEKGLLVRHYTQNIDTLERESGISGDKLVEAHGTFHTNHCISAKCEREYDQAWMKEQIFKDIVPTCEDCNCLVKPDIVFFGEALPDRFYECIRRDFQTCDLLIIMGTSLTVQPFAGLVDRVSNTTPRLLINLTKPADGGSDLLMRLFSGGGMNFSLETGYRDVAKIGTCDDGCLEIVKAMGWEVIPVLVLEEFNKLLPKKDG